jgi:hypothetical protein
MKFFKALMVSVSTLLMISGFQNCAKRGFINGDLNGNFILMGVDGSSSVLLEEGKNYSIEVLGSEKIMSEGLDYSKSRLIKIGGSCAAQHMQPWDKNASPSTEAAVVSPLINAGLPFQADDDEEVKMNLESLGNSVDQLLLAQAPVVEVTIPWNPAEPLPAPRNNVGSGSGSGQGSGQVVGNPASEASQGVNPLGKMSFQSLNSASSSVDFIDVGLNGVNYNAEMAGRMNGCRWLGCVRSKDQNYEACVEFKTPFSPCSFGGAEVPHNGSVVAYQSASVPFGQSCVQETRSCSNGSLSGSFSQKSCIPLSPGACLFDGKEVAHGSAVKAYSSASVPFGQSCAVESRVCNNGVLSGSFSNTGCLQAAPQACEFQGQIVAHGASVPAFSSASVPFGQSCVGEARVCNNGVLSGSYSQSSCAPSAPVACEFNGQPVAHNSSVTAFQSASVPYGQSCVAQTRNCFNGVLSGNLQVGSCIVEPPPPPPPFCTYTPFTVADEMGVTKCLATRTNGSCSVSFPESKIAPMASIPANQIKAMFLNQNYYTNTSSGNLLQQNVCAPNPVESPFEVSDLEMKLQNDGKPATWSRGGRKGHYSSAAWTGSSLAITASAWGWDDSGGRGCIDRIKGFIEHGPANCRACDVIPNLHGALCGQPEAGAFLKSCRSFNIASVRNRATSYSFPFQVGDLELVQQYSRCFRGMGLCELGKTVRVNGNKVEVLGGCQAKFKVYPVGMKSPNPFRGKSPINCSSNYSFEVHWRNVSQLQGASVCNP